MRSVLLISSFPFKRHSVQAEPASRLYCLLTPHNIIWNIFETTQAFMLLVRLLKLTERTKSVSLKTLSVDRLLLVVLPTWYLARNASYALKMVSVPFLHGLVAAIVRDLQFPAL